MRVHACVVNKQTVCGVCAVCGEDMRVWVGVREGEWRECGSVIKFFCSPGGSHLILLIWGNKNETSIASRTAAVASCSTFSASQYL